MLFSDVAHLVEDVLFAWVDDTSHALEVAIIALVQ